VSFANRLKNEKILLKIALGISILWVIAQIALIVCFWGEPQVVDMGAYISIAQHCFNNGQWYPMAEDVYSKYIWAPGYINYLILQLRIFGTVNFNAVLNLILNIAILLEVYYLSKKFFSKRIGLISVIIFCSFYSNLFIVIGANTENPFLFLCLSALCLVFSGKWKCVIGAALLFALANWIRPLSIIFLFTSAIYFFITKTKFYNYIALMIPYILALFIIGTVTEKKIGYFVYQSTTSGYNLLMASHNNAKGHVNTLIFEEGGVGFIEDSLTFVEKDSIWRVRSFQWIKEHPIKFGILFFKKSIALYIYDTWSTSSHLYITTAPDYLTEGSISKYVFIKEQLKRCLKSTPYYLAFLFCFYALWTNRKEILSVKSIFLVIPITGTAITCIFSVLTRYHYPFIFTVTIYAAWGVDTLIQRKLGDDKNSPS
jgi:hypothetical protein